MSLDDTGRVAIDSAVLDYMHRGQAMDNWNVIQFIADSYEVTSATGAVNKVPYLTTHPQEKTRVRVIRHKDHNSIVKLQGRRLPRSDRQEDRALYCASMMMLFTPWRQVGDIQRGSDDWEDAYRMFHNDASQDIRDMISNIQQRYRAEDAATREYEDSQESGQGRMEQDRLDSEEPESDGEPHSITVEITAEMIRRVREQQVNPAEMKHALSAVAIGHEHGVFSATRGTGNEPGAHTASDADIGNLQMWREAIDSQLQASGQDINMMNTEPTQRGDVYTINTEDIPSEVTPIVEMAEEAIQPMQPDELLPDQRRAYDLVTNHLNRLLEGSKPDQLLMQIHGEGGTGKSRVIQTITQYFKNRGVQHMLLKMAYTGIAASLIEGKTTHTATSMSVNSSGISAAAKSKLAKTWGHVEYVIIDEISMISRKFFAELSKRVAVGKGAPHTSHLPFGGVNVIICGDLHQFPPVASRARAALYYPANLSLKDTEDEVLGRMIYEQFQTVVILTQQVRVSDPIWRKLLDHLRKGEMSEGDINELHKLTIGDPKCVETDYTSEEWKDACLVTPRHAVRRLWNEWAVRRHSEDQGVVRFISPAEYKVKNRDLTMREQLVVAQQKKKKHDDTKNNLPDEIILAKGMKVMVTVNIHTDLDIANGTRGRIVDIILDPGEDAIPEGVKEVRLKKPPCYVLVELDNTRLEALPGLDKGVVPIVPISKDIRIEEKDTQTGAISKKTVRKTQLPITAAYAFTDYRSQGQTIRNVIVDIGKPPTNELSLFNVYVALSRSSGRRTIRLLRGFDDKLFTKSVGEELMLEDERLAELNMNTKLLYEDGIRYT